jgi:hypothetical protein
MNNMMTVVFGLSAEYRSEYGGAGKQETFVYFEMCIPDLSNRRGKSPRSMIHVQVTYLKSSYVIRETGVGMMYGLGYLGYSIDLDLCSTIVLL